MIYEGDYILDFPHNDSLGDSLLRMLTNEALSLDLENGLHTQDVRDCKLLCSLISVQGLPRRNSWFDESKSYVCTVKLNEEEKDYRLVQQASKPGCFLARTANPEVTCWETTDYFSQSKLSFTIHKQGWFSRKPLAHASLSFQNILRRQLARAPTAGALQWYFEEKIPLELLTNHSKVAKRNAAWKSPTHSLQSKLMTLHHPEAENRGEEQHKRPAITLTFHFRLVFLQQCLELVPRGPSSSTVAASEFHVLCASAPGPVLANMMKALASKSLLNRALTLATSEGLNALEVALVRGNVAAVITLLQRAGRLCFPALRTGKRCIVHHAVQGNSCACFDALRRFLKKYGSLSRSTDGHLHLPTLLDWRDDQDHTPLTLACSLTPRNQIVEFLLMAGAEISSVNSTTGYSALMYACATGSTGIVSTLLSVTRSDQEMLVNVSGAEVHTEDALSRHIRVNAHSRRLVLGRDGYELSLPSYSCNPTYRDKLGRQALHIAAIAGHAAICSALLRVGVSLASADYQGNNVFHLVCEVGHFSLLQDLIKAERDRWQNYLTVERPRALENMLRVVQPLLALNQLSLSPAEVALMNGQLDLATLLLDQAMAIYGAQFLSDAQISRMDDARRRLLHAENLLRVRPASSAELTPVDLAADSPVRAAEWRWRRPSSSAVEPGAEDRRDREGDVAEEKPAVGIHVKVAKWVSGRGDHEEDKDEEEEEKAEEKLRGSGLGHDVASSTRQLVPEAASKGAIESPASLSEKLREALAAECEEEEEADRINYHFALTAWTAKLMGLSESEPLP